jgi:hypothetical protein
MHTIHFIGAILSFARYLTYTAILTYMFEKMKTFYFSAKAIFILRIVLCVALACGVLFNLYFEFESQLILNTKIYFFFHVFKVLVTDVVSVSKFDGESMVKWLPTDKVFSDHPFDFSARFYRN